MTFQQANGSAPGDPYSSPRTRKPLTGWVVLVLATLALGGRPAAALVHASILVDARTGQVLQEYHPDALAHPASLTKLMTLYLTFQRLESGDIRLDSEFHVSRFAAWQEPSKLGLLPGTTISVRDCILGITGHSANDAAMVLAENIGGNETDFVRLMNEEARRLGMTRTVFYNANGLPDNRQWTTARDMSTLALALIRTFPQYYHFFDTPSFEFEGRTIHGFDHLLDEYPGVDGMKTGYIHSSGFNIVTSAVRDHRRLVGVVLGGRTARARDLQMIGLLNAGFAVPSAATTMVASTADPSAPAAALSQAAAHPVSDVLARPVARRVDMRERARRAAPVERARRRTYSVDLAGVRRWTIQIGDRIRTRDSAYRVLRSARSCAPTPLRRGRAEVIRLRGWDYRARFSGLSLAMAHRACSDLDDRRFTCRVLPQVDQHRAEYAADLAAALPSGE